MSGIRCQDDKSQTVDLSCNVHSTEYNRAARRKRGSAGQSHSNNPGNDCDVCDCTNLQRWIASKNQLFIIPPPRERRAKDSLQNHVGTRQCRFETVSDYGVTIKAQPLRPLNRVCNFYCGKCHRFFILSSSTPLSPIRCRGKGRKCLTTLQTPELNHQHS